MKTRLPACPTWLLMFAWALAPSVARADDTRDLGRFFPHYKSALVVLDLSTGQLTRHNPDMARRGFSPCSTFKIPNSLIGLETGVISGPDNPQTRRPRQGCGSNA